MNGEGKFSVIAGVMGGLTIGWLFRNYNYKRKQLAGYESFLDRAKKLEKKVSADGKKRADQIDFIKQEVHKQESE